MKEILIQQIMNNIEKKKIFSNNFPNLYLMVFLIFLIVPNNTISLNININNYIKFFF